VCAAARQQIETPRLIGHRVTEDDFEYLAKTDSDWRIQEHVYGKVQTREESRLHLERCLRRWDQSGYGLWIFTTKHAETIGHADLFPSPESPGNLEIGWVVLPELWNNGYATEMAIACLGVAFDDLQASRVVANAQARNTGSRHVMDKCGMTPESEYIYRDGSPSVRYSIDRKTWTARTR